MNDFFTHEGDPRSAIERSTILMIASFLIADRLSGASKTPNHALPFLVQSEPLDALAAPWQALDAHDAGQHLRRDVLRAGCTRP